MADKVEMISGFEPLRPGEYPVCYRLGHKIDARRGPVTEIRYREDNYGDHGLGWWDIYEGDVRAASMAARAVADIVWQVGEKANG